MSSSTGAKRFLPAVRSQADFDQVARIYNAKTPYALPHAMFVIDRRDKNKIYYVNSQMFRFHQDFANAQYLLGKILLGRGDTEQAIGHLEIAAQLAPEEANTRYQLARAYQKAGRSEQAAREFEAYQRLKDKQRGKTP